MLLDERSGSLEAVKKQILKLIKKYSTKMIVIDPINDFLNFYFCFFLRIFALLTNNSFCYEKKDL